ncbi:MAG TPA: hypothetical protein VGM39_00815, partial [Kofleriaceae bacterium]
SEDTAKLGELHGLLASSDWTYTRSISSSTVPAIVAVADYKWRLLFSSAAGDTFGNDISSLPAVRAALDGKNGGSVLGLMRYDDPVLHESKVLGKGTPPSVLAFVYARALVLAKTPRSVLFYVLPASSLLEEVSLPDVPMSVLALDGTNDGPIASTTISNPPEDVRIKLVPLIAPGGEKLGDVVLMGRLTGALSIFPHARQVLLATSLLALLASFATWRRARRIAGARAG